MLTDTTIRAAKARAKSYKLADSGRLYLFVTPAGGKLWRWGYRFDGKQKGMAFGSYPAVSLIDARAKRDEAQAVLSAGRDPAIVKKLKIEAQLEAFRQTFERSARAWHENAKGQWAKRHANDVLRSLERDVFPALGNLPIAEISPPLVLAALREIEARGSIETAKRILQRITAVFGFAIAEGIIEKDPSARVGAALKPLRRGRQPAILQIVPLRKMIITAEQDDARPVTRLALRFLALTAVRPIELRGARWDEFESLNEAEPLWRIPAARMKGNLDRKDELGGDHLVPLAPQAIEVLKALWPLTGEGPLVFPSPRRMHQPMSENALGYLLHRAGYHGHHVPHGFRASFSTIMNEWAERQGKEGDRAIIDLMLAHVPKGKVEGAYNRAAYLQRRRELAQRWAEMLCDGLSKPFALVERAAHPTASRRTRRFNPVAVGSEFRFPVRRPKCFS
jgi:integrase